MFRRVAELIVAWQIKKGYLEEDRCNVMCYSYEVIVMQCVNFLIAVFIGVCFHRLAEVLIFLLSYIPLRSFAGGYHAGRDWICMIESAGIILLVCLLLSGGMFGLWNRGMVVGESAAVILFFLFVPVEVPEKPLSRKEWTRCRGKFFQLLGVEAVWIALLIAVCRVQWCGVILLGHMVLAVLLVIGRIRRRNYDRRFMQ